MKGDLILQLVLVCGGMALFLMGAYSALEGYWWAFVFSIIGLMIFINYTIMLGIFAQANKSVPGGEKR